MEQQPISSQVKINKTQTTLTLTTTDGKLRWNDGSRERCITIEREVLGFGIEEKEGFLVRVKGLVEKESGSCIIRGGGIDKGGGKGIRKREDFLFQFFGEDSFKIFCQKFREFLDSLDRPKRLLVIVNPFGGKRIALKIYNDEVKPLLDAADIEYTMQETQYQLHAKEIVCSLDLSRYDGVVCVSGDGILVEVVNGLLERKDWDTAIKMPLGIVLAGTGNGMVKSLLDSVDECCSVSNAVLAIVRGHKRALDVATVLQGETRFFSVLMLAWGLIADIDIESEKYRWMGSSRLDFYGLMRVFNLRKYNGRVSFVPAPGFEAYGNPCDQKVGCTNIDILFRDQQDTVKVQEHGYQGPVVLMEELKWRTVEGPFVSVWLHNVPWGTEDTMAAPDAQFSDGYLDLIMIKDCPKTSLLMLITKLNDGTHVRSPYVMYLKVSSFLNNLEVPVVIDKYPYVTAIFWQYFKQLVE